MKAIPSIFELISTKFNRNKAKSLKFNSKEHCAVKSHHDFYCEAERPFGTMRTSI
jgi:hypothetical protein